ncbi:hypothetical protein ACEPPN_000605 [Leptodophora sp. 'Broadleaf-Isolate-01']
MVDDGSQAGTASQAVNPVADAAEDPESPSNGRERARYAIPTTVVVRKDSQKSIRKAPIEHSWTLFHYTISELSSTWLKKFKKATEEVYDRLWTCNYCEWSSKDSQRHGNTSATTNHLCDKHELTKAKHQEGGYTIKNNAKGGGGGDGDILQFVSERAQAMGPEEACLRRTL